MKEFLLEVAKIREAFRLRNAADKTGDAELYRKAAEIFEAHCLISNADLCRKKAAHYEAQK